MLTILKVQRMVMLRVLLLLLLLSSALAAVAAFQAGTPIAARQRRAMISHVEDRISPQISRSAAHRTSFLVPTVRLAKCSRRRTPGITIVYRPSPPAAARIQLWMLSSDAAATPNDNNVSGEQEDTDDDETASTTNGDDATAVAKVTTKNRVSWKTKIGNSMKGPDDGLTFKQRIAKMGLATMLSYGWVSNMSYSVTVSIAWYIFSKQVRR
jgi:hypothetical protein